MDVDGRRAVHVDGSHQQLALHLHPGLAGARPDLDDVTDAVNKHKTKPSLLTLAGALGKTVVNKLLVRFVPEPLIQHAFEVDRKRRDYHAMVGNSVAAS